jgi:hypothetical protein
MDDSNLLYSPNATLRSAFSWKFFVKKSPQKIPKKYFQKISVKFFFKCFLANGVPQPIWGMLAKILYPLLIPRIGDLQLRGPKSLY